MWWADTTLRKGTKVKIRWKTGMLRGRRRHAGDLGTVATTLSRPLVAHAPLSTRKRRRQDDCTVCACASAHISFDVRLRWQRVHKMLRLARHQILLMCAHAGRVMGETSLLARQA
jgi:hypothetical protein